MQLVVAYVIGRGGRVERPTLSFVVPPHDAQLVSSVCRAMTEQLFTESGSRVLLLTSFAFDVSAFTPSPPTPFPVDSTLSQLRSMRRDSLFAYLDGLPHCR